MTKSDVKLREFRAAFEADYMARYGVSPCVALNDNVHKNMTYGNATTESEWLGFQAGIKTKYKGKAAEEWCDETCKTVKAYCDLDERNTRHTDHLLEMAVGALSDLLEDTQHSEHKCLDEDCPVKQAKQTLLTLQQHLGKE